MFSLYLASSVNSLEKSKHRSFGGPAAARDPARLKVNAGDPLGGPAVECRRVRRPPGPTKHWEQGCLSQRQRLLDREVNLIGVRVAGQLAQARGLLRLPRNGILHLVQ